MPRHLKLGLFVMLLLIAGGAVYFQGLHKDLLRLARGQQSEEQNRRAVIHPSIATPTDVKTHAKIFWAVDAARTSLEPVQVEMPLSADPAQRARQVLNTLVMGPPNPELRTLPAETSLLEFYLLEDGTAVADFSDALANQTPSGIATEQLALDSIVRTLEANVNSAKRLKILIRGLEAETLAGHVDVSGFIALHPEVPAAKPASAGLTPPPPPVKLP
ncbi:MAG: GerMN domain-containing protein [Acidobacteria bacterium]|nr:GerMN domain-containing protein [Acidobacteriota bacterium]